MDEKSGRGDVLRVCLITQKLSQVVAALNAEPRIKIISIIESAPRADSDASRFKHQLRKFYRYLSGNSLERYAKARDIPFSVLTKEHIQCFGNQLKDQQCDVIIVSSMAHLLPATVLAIPRFGVLNLHPSILPAYRGPDPIFWMFANTETMGGVTLHYLDSGEDTGDIVYQTQFAINHGMSAREVLDMAIEKHGTELVLTALKVLADGGKLPRTTQSRESPTPRARRVSRTKANDYRTVIDWQTWRVERIWHFLRGSEAWIDAIAPPTGITVGQRWTVLGYEKKDIAHPPLGSIQKDIHGHYLACKDGIVRLRAPFKISNILKFLYRKL